MAGGLALLWRKDVDVNLLSYSTNHIDADVALPGEESRWRFTGFYGFRNSISDTGHGIFYVN